MAPISSLLFPAKSHRKPVLLPEYSPELAEFFGIMMGDGGIGNPWQANITLNSIADREYSSHVIALSEELFGITPKLIQRKDKNALIHQINSTSVVDFLVENGLPRGNKILNKLSIPSWIMAAEHFRSRCLRGLMDTDGCIYTHRHTVNGKQYINVGLNFSSYANDLFAQARSIFEEFGFMPHINRRGNGLFIYREKEIARYLEIIGTSNPRISSAFERNLRTKSGGVG